jgi:hypothetical protein
MPPYSGIPRARRWYYPDVDSLTFLRALWAGLKAFLRAAWLSVRQLFHQITGVFFLMFAVIGWGALYREWHRWPGYKLVVAGIFTAVFTAFTIESFVKARRIH